MTIEGRETTLEGLALSPGIIIGRVWLIDNQKARAIKKSIAEKDVEREIRRLQKAVEESKKQLTKIKKEVFSEEQKDHQYIIDAHLMMLEDKMLIEDSISNIRNEKVCAEWAISTVINELKKIFENIDDYYLRERGGDIDHVGDRILKNLIGEEQTQLSNINEKVVVVAHDLSPADTAQMDKEKIVGFAIDIGGKTSHTSIVARALEIPAVGGLEEITALVETGDHIIVDGLKGRVVLNPGRELFQKYLKRQQKYNYIEKEIYKYADLPAETLDGTRIRIAGNIEMIEEIPSLISHGGEGIGLYRTEFLYIGRSEAPSEEEHYNVYCDVIKKVAPHAVTIRTLDVGMDKMIPYFNHPVELNPAMGVRSIRFCLKEPEIFKTQLRAILRASAHGDIRVMFPMISGVLELRMAKKMLEEAKSELERDGLSFNKDIKTGIMVEIPSAAMTADILAKEVDFFSIGTNDLIQYALAIDRVNEHVAYLYEPLHPAILRTVKGIVEAAHDAGIKVSMCGEMASDPTYSFILLGLGLDELSMNAFSIPRVKKVIRNISIKDANAITEKVLSLATEDEIKDYLKETIRNRFSGELWEEFDF